MPHPDDQKMVPASQAGAEDRRDLALGRLKQVQMGIAPTNLSEGFQLAEMLAKSTLVPKDFQGNPGNVLIAIQMGIEIGLAPMQALQSIAVINGRPSIWGDGLLALVVNSGLLVGQPVESYKDGVASCTVQRKGWPHPVTKTFSIDDAKKARLWTKPGPWQEYPERMLQMRARAFALRDVFPDVLRGLAVAEEQRDIAPAIEGAVVDVKPDINAQMRSELGCTEGEYAAVLMNWDTLKTPPAQRLVQAKQFSGRVRDLLDELGAVVLRTLQDKTVVQPVQPQELSKPMRRRHAKAKEEAHAPAPAPRDEQGIAESIAESLGPDTGAAAPPPTTEPVQTGECCEHGVLIDQPCQACKDEAARIDAEIAAKETPFQLGKVAPRDTLPL